MSNYSFSHSVFVKTRTADMCKPGFVWERVKGLMKLAEISPNTQKTLGKGELARYEQFLLFPHCFQKTQTADM